MPANHLIPNIISLKGYVLLTSIYLYKTFYKIIESIIIHSKARSHQRADQLPLSLALEKWKNQECAGLDRRERILV